MMRLKSLFFVLLALAGSAFAQASSCPAPTPGTPHVCLKWTASTTSGVTYNVYRGTTPGGENYASPLNGAPVSAVFFYDTTTATGTTYYYTVVAVGTGGVLSAPSTEASAQIPVPPAPPTGVLPTID